MEPNSGRRSAGSRCAALVGPYLSGKTTLLEAILLRTGATQRQGKISEKSTIGDASAEARLHGMSVELNVASTQYLGERYTFVDCPGSIEFNQDIGTALIGCDVAVVVCEADEKKVPIFFRSGWLLALSARPNSLRWMSRTSTSTADWSAG